MKKVILILALTLAFTHQSTAQVFANFEGLSVWQSRNVFQIPGTTGTRVDLADFDKGPIFGYRIYLGKRWNNKHEIRALYAPLSVRLNSVMLDQSTRFQDTDFAANTATDAYYKFNSYRLGYTYFFNPLGEWTLALGLTAKIRDAEIRLEQGTLVSAKKNVGFVPLIRFEASRNLGEGAKIRFDVDGLGAPQGRAIDATIKLEKYLGYFGAGHSLWSFLGYRTVEGGADNDVVYNFAWFHALSLGMFAEF